MRKTALVAGLLLCGAFGGSAHAGDPYRWCAEYAGGDIGSGGSNCYFVTLEQCRATISGNGGFCTQNQFYTGPDASREARPARRADGKRSRMQ